MFFLRCSLIAFSFFSAFSKVSFFSTPSSFKYAFNFFPKIFVVGIPYWSLRIIPILEGEFFSASSAMIFFNSGSFILTHVGFCNCFIYIVWNFGF